MGRYELERVAGATIVRWVATPLKEDVGKLTRELLDSGPRGELGLFIVILSDQVDAPDAETRAAFHENSPQIMDWFVSVDVIVTGSAFRRSITVALIRTMSVLSGTRQRMKVHASVDHALAARNPGREAADALRALV